MKQMPFHLSLIACDHGSWDKTCLREELDARALEIWASPGVVAVAVLADAGKCGFLTTRIDKASFEAWQQKISYRKLQDFLLRLSASRQYRFDSAFQEANIAPPAHRAANRDMISRSVVPLRRPSE